MSPKTVSSGTVPPGTVPPEAARSELSNLDSAIPRIECRQLVQQLPSGGSVLTVLDRVDLTLQAGEFVAVLGPSGSGKSTLLGLLAGLDRATSGSVLLDGQPLGDLNEDRLALLRREKVGIIFQSFQLLGNLTAYENVRLPLDLNSVDSAHERTTQLLDRVGLSERSHHYPSQLSGGEQQRVAIARAFGPRPAILLADEPTGNLDFETGRSVLDLLVELRREESMTVVLVTHDPNVAALTDRQIHLEGGRLIRDERPEGSVPVEADPREAVQQKVTPPAPTGDSE